MGELGVGNSTTSRASRKQREQKGPFHASTRFQPPVLPADPTPLVPSPPWPLSLDKCICPQHLLQVHTQRLNLHTQRVGLAHRQLQQLTVEHEAASQHLRKGR